MSPSTEHIIIAPVLIPFFAGAIMLLYDERRRRAKLVLQTNDGWLSANALDGAPLHWQSSEWRQDSRLELIFSAAQDATTLQAGFLACRQ